MQYDFETVTPRYNMGSSKWNAVQAIYPEMPADIVPFSVADMEFPTAPEIAQGLKHFIDISVLGYANATDSFKEAVCHWMKVRHNWDAKPEWILPSHGCVDAFYEAIQCFSKEGDGVLLLTPVYYPMYNAIKVNNRKLVDCPLVPNGKTYDINWADFEAKISDENTKLFLMCSPHNPCGRIWKKEELERIAELCQRHNVLVIDDEIHNDLIMPGYTHTVYATISPYAEQHCVVLTAPSKTFNLAGLVGSYSVIYNEYIRNRVAKGGHDIPPEDVLRRFNHRFADVARILPYCDQAVFYDNENGFTEVAEYKNGELLLKGDYRPSWILELLDYLKKND